MNKLNLLRTATDTDRDAATFTQDGPNAAKAAKRAKNCTQVSTTDDYPWGRQLRCTRSIWIELDGLTEVKKGKDKGKLKIGKGTRVVTQTVDPRTGRVCAAKAGTYSHGGVSVLYTDAETGHVNHHHISFNGPEAIEAAAAFLAEHPEVANLPAAFHAYAWSVVRMCTVANARYTQWRDGVTIEEKRAAVKIVEIAGAAASKAPITDLGRIAPKAADVATLTAK